MENTLAAWFGRIAPLRGARLGVVALVAAALAAAPLPAADTLALSVDASKPGARIDRQLFGQFAEHLGTGVY